MKLNSECWDCECNEHYIHSAEDALCPLCGAERDEQPDARQNEIDEGTHFFVVEGR
jgi:Zn finger protein HypA/HybF involved in hydrogenase expression